MVQPNKTQYLTLELLRQMIERLVLRHRQNNFDIPDRVEQTH